MWIYLFITACIFRPFQARNIRTSELAAIKIVKLDPGMLNLTQHAHMLHVDFFPSDIVIFSLLFELNL